MSDYQETPPFLVWSIRHACQLRQRMVDDQPTSCERYLRPVRAWGDAVRDRRVIDDVCLSSKDVDKSTLGFPIAETLTAYGGPKQITDCCTCCDCNVSIDEPASMAGCYGEAPLPMPEDAIWQQFEEACKNLTEDSKWASIPQTRPKWYGLWLSSCNEGEWLELIRRFLDAWKEHLPNRGDSQSVATNTNLEATEKSWKRLSMAVDRCCHHHLTLDLQLIPAGIQEGRSWRILPHCANCRSSMNLGEVRCVVCGKQGKPQHGANRCARGRRPFMPLQVFLTETEIAGLRRAGSSEY